MKLLAERPINLATESTEDTEKRWIGPTPLHVSIMTTHAGVTEAPIKSLSSSVSSVLSVARFQQHLHTGKLSHVT